MFITMILEKSSGDRNKNSCTVNQTNNSPKALSRLEIYRLMRNTVNM